MKCKMVIIRLLLAFLSSALFVLATGAQGFSAEGSQAPDTINMKVIQSLQEDIAKHPLKPPDSSSPRATNLRHSL